MYGNTPASNNTSLYQPVLERNFGTLVYATDYAYGMPYSLEYSRTSKFRVDGQILWMIMISNGLSPMFVELEGD